MQMANCPKCRSTNIAQDVDLGTSKDSTRVRVRKLLERGVLQNVRVECELRASVCTDCGHVEFDLVPLFGELKDLLLPRAGRAPTTPVAW